MKSYKNYIGCRKAANIALNPATSNSVLIAKITEKLTSQEFDHQLALKRQVSLETKNIEEYRRI